MAAGVPKVENVVVIDVRGAEQLLEQQWIRGTKLLHAYA